MEVRMEWNVKMVKCKSLQSKIIPVRKNTELGIEMAMKRKK
jgi:hypothetical protein